MRAARAGALLACLMAAASGCELREITLTEPDRAVVAEAYVRVEAPSVPGGSGTGRASVLLHETLGPTGGSGMVPGARVVVTRSHDGLEVGFEEVALESCVIVTPVEGSGTCYLPESEAAIAELDPGDRLELRITLADGGALESETVVPGAFELRNVSSGDTCVLPPGRQSGIVWSSSAGAWAYVSDTFVSGLAPILGTELVDDPLYLLGLSVSAHDTTIAFPGEFGLFARGELDQEVSLTLQQGLPPGTSAVVTVAAVDRNWVNWVRGGNFNPSGVVRVPSVRGSGTGVFAAAVTHAFRVVGAEANGEKPPCPPAEARSSASGTSSRS